MELQKQVEYLARRLELVEDVIANFLFMSNKNMENFDSEQEELIKEFEGKK